VQCIIHYELLCGATGVQCIIHTVLLCGATGVQCIIHYVLPCGATGVQCAAVRCNRRAMCKLTTCTNQEPGRQQPLRAPLFQLACLWVCNTQINNVEKRVGVAVPGVLCCWASAIAASVAYYQTDATAGQILVSLHLIFESALLLCLFFIKDTNTGAEVRCLFLLFTHPRMQSKCKACIQNLHTKACTHTHTHTHKGAGVCTAQCRRPQLCGSGLRVH